MVSLSASKLKIPLQFHELGPLPEPFIINYSEPLLSPHSSSTIYSPPSSPSFFSSSSSSCQYPETVNQSLHLHSFKSSPNPFDDSIPSTQIPIVPAVLPSSNLTSIVSVSSTQLFASPSSTRLSNHHHRRPLSSTSSHPKESIVSSAVVKRVSSLTALNFSSFIGLSANRCRCHHSSTCRTVASHCSKSVFVSRTVPPASSTSVPTSTACATSPQARRAGTSTLRYFTTWAADHPVNFSSRKRSTSTSAIDSLLAEIVVAPAVYLRRRRSAADQEQ